MTTVEERVARLEGMMERINTELTTMNSRINTQIQLTVAMWVTTIVGVLGTLGAVLAILFKM